MTTRARPILLVDSDPGIVALVRKALGVLKGDHPLIVVSQPAEVRQYLVDASRSNTSPAAIILQGRAPAATSLLSWMDDQQHAIPEIRIVALGSPPSLPHFHRVDAAVELVTAEALVDALCEVLRDNGPAPWSGKVQ